MIYDVFVAVLLLWVKKVKYPCKCSYNKMNELSFFDQKTLQLYQFAILCGLLQMSFSILQILTIHCSSPGGVYFGRSFYSACGRKKTKINKSKVERYLLFCHKVPAIRDRTSIKITGVCRGIQFRINCLIATYHWINNSDH